MIDTILFDLDATLVPINQELFIKRYMNELAMKATELGYDKDIILKGIWVGTMDMLKNDGLRTNADVFWETFTKLCGQELRCLEPIFEDFYAVEFHKIEAEIKPKCSYRQFFDYLKNKGYTIALATNPLFPYVATVSRLSWIGLTTDDFDFITTYDNSSYCKPDMRYYNEILDKIGKNVEDCIMVGNNAIDDMCVNEELGMEVFLVTDFIENATGVDISKYRNGSMNELKKFFGFSETI